MTENIQLQKIVVYGVIIKMSGDNLGVLRWVLYGCKGVHILSHRKHDYTARVLSRGSFDAYTACNNAVDLAVFFRLIFLFKVFFDISESGLIRETGYRSRAVGLPLAEDDLRVFMRLCLVFAGEIEVDIRFLISLKAQKGLEGNVEAVLYKLRSAYGAFFVRQVAAGGTGIALYLIGIKIAVMTNLAPVMRT